MLLQEPKLEEATTSFMATPPLDTSLPLCPSKLDVELNGGAGIALNGTVGTNNNIGSPCSAIFDENAEEELNKDDFDKASLTYRGIYLPTLTNRFKERKLETAYQRYACRQVG